MKSGGKLVCGLFLTALAGCGGEQGKLEVRPIPTPLAQGAKPVSFRVAEARGQLALGNVALALESFRKAQREDASSVEALAGIAECYDRMGRFDLSRRNYEAALAIAPADLDLLGAFAASLARQGRAVEAASVRQEIALRRAAASPVATAAVIEPAIEAPLAVAAAEQARVAPKAEFFVADPLPQIAEVQEPSAPIQPERLMAEAPVQVAATQPNVPETSEAAKPIAARSVTVALPPPRPLVDAPSRQVAAVPAKPKLAEPNPVRGPRLERLSMGVVALITADGPQWRSELVTQTARSAKVRFVPVRSETALAEVRLLNAARVHRLAARTRAYLAGRGWRDISIGDANKVRARSLILYPARQRILARKLSAQFGFAAAPNQGVEQVTILLGRDAVRIAGARKSA
jgi:tetratricopeptide (TPR) repeat protein